MSLYDRNQNRYNIISIIGHRIKESITDIIVRIVMQIAVICVMYTFRFDTILLVILFIGSLINILNIIDDIYYIRTGDRILKCKLDN